MKKLNPKRTTAAIERQQVKRPQSLKAATRKLTVKSTNRGRKKIAP
jgi:hypothetical protein